MNKMKPCPFCGSGLIMQCIDTPFYYIACDNCGNKTMLHNSQTEAIESWNTRSFPCHKWPDEKPKEYGNYLCLYPSTIVDDPYYSIRYYDDIDKTFRTKKCGKRFNPNYWMELPEPPEDTK